MPTQSPRSAAEILAFLNQGRETPSPALESRRDQYRQAAAVLVALRDPKNLKPVGGGFQPHEGVRLLGPELIRATGRKFDGELMLHPDARRKAITEMPTLAARRIALDTNPSERTGEVQIQLEKYLLGKAQPLEEQSTKELDETLQIATWLHGVVDNLPNPAEVQGRLTHYWLMEPFETLAGDAIFRGRRAEMDALRSYVGVVEPAALLRRLRDRALRWAKPAALPAVCITGPGGVGKSALIARFMLEHSRVPANARIPFAYLDFDRPSLNISEPGTLLAEMLRQIDAQFAAEGYFAELRRFFEEHMGTGERPADEKEAKNYDPRVLSILADLVGLMEARLGPRPYIVVLDTFEEVQYRGESRALPFWELLDRMQHARPFLRVVLSGRASADTLRLGGKAPVHIELGDLDTDAAVAYVQGQGIADVELARALVKQFGGVPLSLKLAASVVKRNPDELKLVGGKSTFWFSQTDEVIQGQLYSRILGHLHDPALQRLAHPGLVLRRITPDVILNVLNTPCQLGLSTKEEAVDLFQRLRNETSLVTADTVDGSLVHRSDLRRAILKMLEKSAPAQTTQIHQAAVQWYAQQTGWRDKAEELYHRLQLVTGASSLSASLGSPLPMSLGSIGPSRLLEHPDVRASLQLSISELPVAAQRFLATSGFQVAPEVMEKASDQERDASLAAQVEELLPFGSRGVEHADRLLLESSMPTDRSSPLFRSAARVSAQKGRDENAAKLLHEGMRLAMDGSTPDEILDLLSEQAWLFARRPDLGDFAASLDALAEQARRCESLTGNLQHRLQAYTLVRGKSESPDRGTLREIAGLLAQLSPLSLWDIFPLLTDVLDPLFEEVPEASLTLQTLINDKEGPFHRVELQDGVAAKALYDVLALGDRVSRSPLKPPRRRQWAEFLTGLASRWPYRILRVKPPYSDSSYETQARV